MRRYKALGCLLSVLTFAVVLGGLEVIIHHREIIPDIPLYQLFIGFVVATTLFVIGFNALDRHLQHIIDYGDDTELQDMMQHNEQESDEA